MPEIARDTSSLDDALKAHRRRLILEAARKVFEKHGLEGASIRAIAQAAGCTTGAIYPHFDGKEEIFALVLSESLESLRAAVEAAVGRTRAPARGIRRATLAIYKYYEDRPLDLALALYLFNGTRPAALGGGLDADLAARLEAVLDLLSGQVRLLCPAPFAPMVRVEATALFTYLVGLLVLRHSGRVDALSGNAAVLLAHYTGNLVKRLTAR